MLNFTARVPDNGGWMSPKSPFSLHLFAGIAVMAGLVFGSSGRLDYWQGWLYFGLNAGLLLLSTWIIRSDSGLISERLHPGKGMKWWDKGYFALSTPLYFGAVVVAGLDASRFHWGPHPPAVVYGLALAAFVAGQGLMMWAKKVNPFFSSVARIQADRGQYVCREGPYRICRHPGYLGGLLFGLATPFVLGSYWALIPQGLAAVLLVVRAALEDKMLKKGLLWYSEYAGTVRSLLVPGLW